MPAQKLATDQFGPQRPGCGTPFDGLYLGGVSTRSGHGIVGAMTGGMASASAVLRRDLRADVARARLRPAAREARI